MNLSPPRFTDGTELQSGSERGPEMAIAGERILPQRLPSQKEGLQLRDRGASSPAKSSSQNQDLAHVDGNAAEDGASPSSPHQIPHHSTFDGGHEPYLKIASSHALNEK